jgi:MFS family permease
VTNRWSVLAVLFLARMAMAFQFQAVATLAPLIGETYGRGLADIGFLIGLYFAPGVVVAIPGSTLAARLGERRVVVAAMVLMLLGGALMWAGTGWTALVAGRVLAGIGGVTINVVLTKMLVDWFAGREISTAMAVYINSLPVGIAFALLVLPRTVSAGLAAAWATVLVVIAVGLALFILVYRAPEAAPDSAAAPGAGRPALAPLLAAAWIWAFYNAALAMVFSFGPVLLIARGWTLAAAGSATGLFMVVLSVAVPLGGVLADRSGGRDAVIAASLAGFMVLLIATLSAPDGLVAPLLALTGLASGLAAGPVMGLPAQVLAPPARAFGMGVFFTVYYAVFLAAPPFAGGLADLSGDPGAPFLLGSAMLLSCLAALVFFRRAAVA